MQTVTVTLAKPAKRSLVSFRKIGGMYHWRIGKTGGSFYRPMPLLALAATLAIGTSAAPARGDYSVILTVANGNEYVTDYDLTLTDCMDSVAHEWPDAICVEQPE